ncbi:hypothetical protein BT69DRAFT_1280322 [Atractiella rhizophila]|nr:hypothetical protein BT69DRAFT_1280322 [Atractiella rhizophila]
MASSTASSESSSSASGSSSEGEELTHRASLSRHSRPYRERLQAPEAERPYGISSSSSSEDDDDEAPPALSTSAFKSKKPNVILRRVLARTIWAMEREKWGMVRTGLGDVEKFLEKGKGRGLGKGREMPVLVRLHKSWSELSSGRFSTKEYKHSLSSSDSKALNALVQRFKHLPEDCIWNKLVAVCEAMEPPFPFLLNSSGRLESKFVASLEINLLLSDGPGTTTLDMRDMDNWEQKLTGESFKRILKYYASFEEDGDFRWDTLLSTLTSLDLRGNHGQIFKRFIFRAILACFLQRLCCSRSYPESLPNHARRFRHLQNSLCPNPSVAPFPSLLSSCLSLVLKHRTVAELSEASLPVHIQASLLNGYRCVGCHEFVSPTFTPDLYVAAFEQNDLRESVLWFTTPWTTDNARIINKALNDRFYKAHAALERRTIVVGKKGWKFCQRCLWKHATRNHCSCLMCLKEEEQVKSGTLRFWRVWED